VAFLTQITAAIYARKEHPNFIFNKKAIFSQKIVIIALARRLEEGCLKTEVVSENGLGAGPRMSKSNELCWKNHV
jgi:hypothetical protein